MNFDSDHTNEISKTLVFHLNFISDERNKYFNEISMKKFI